jgi:membrane protease YdiL (CAAX protease family)
MEPTTPSPGEPHTFLQDRNIHPAAFGALVLVGVFLLYQIGGGIMTFVAMGDLNVTASNVGMVRLVTLLSQLLFILAPTLILSRLVSRDPLEVFPLRMPTVREFAVLLLALLSLQRVLETVVYLQRLIPLPPAVEAFVGPLKEMLKSMMGLLLASDSIPEFLFVGLVVAVVPAFVEEFYFRGLVQTLFRKATTPLIGGLASGVLFGLFHLTRSGLWPLASFSATRAIGRRASCPRSCSISSTTSSLSSPSAWALPTTRCFSNRWVPRQICRRC